jgi:hypothetical protein
MLAGLLMMAMPVSAASGLSWSKMDSLPVTPATSANVFAVAGDGKTIYLWTDFDAAELDPDGSDSSDSWDNSDQELEYRLYKTTNTGDTWSDVDYEIDADDEPENFVSVKVCQSDSTELIATDGIHVYTSSDSGDEWEQNDPDDLPDGCTITSIDIGINGDDDIVYAVGVANGGDGGVALNDDGWMTTWNDDLGAEGTWGYDMSAGNDFADTDSATYDCYAVAISPDYDDDEGLVALVGNGDGVWVRTIASATDEEEWDYEVFPCRIGDDSGDYVAFDGMIGSLALPENYDYSSTSYAKVFVGIGNTGDDDAAFVGTFRTVPGSNSMKDSYDTIEDINVYSLSYKGTLSSGYLAVGLYDSTDVYVSDDAGTAGDGDASYTESDDNDSSPTSNSSTPSVLVVFSPTETCLYAGTTGYDAVDDDDYGCSELAVSNSDYDGFSGFAFVQVSDLDNVNIGKYKGYGTEYQFLRVHDVGGYNADADEATIYMAWYSSNGGDNWKMIRNNDDVVIDGFSITGDFANDQTIYIVQIEDGSFIKKILKTTDAGESWTKITSPGAVEVSSISLVDSSTYWCGSTDGIRLSGTSSTADLDGNTPQVMIPIPGFFVVLCNEGCFWVSTDDGASFEMLGDDESQFVAVPGSFIGGPPGNFAIDPPTKTIYAQEASSGDILSWTVGVDDDWQDFIDIGDLPPEIDDVLETSSIALDHGVWYVKSVNDTDGVSQLWRSVDLDDDDYKGFVPVIGTAYDDSLGGKFTNGPINIAHDSNGNPVYYDGVILEDPSEDEYAQQIKYFVDTLIVPPGTNYPVADASVSANADFSWNSVSGSSIKYDIEVSYDPDFSSNVLEGIFDNGNAFTRTTGLQLSSVGLEAGQTYYWHVRACKLSGEIDGDDAYMVSKWSDPIKFTTELKSTAETGLDVEGRMSPVNGATGVETNAALTWGTVDDATGYNLVIAKDSAFTNVVESKDGLTLNVYSPSKPFEVGTTYYWKVQAVSGITTGKWVASAFTTAPMAAASAGTAAAQPVVTPTFTVSIPAQSAPVINMPSEAPVAPSTPAYVWVIIVIGAILVIAVIVLIVRTRRV